MKPRNCRSLQQGPERPGRRRRPSARDRVGSVSVSTSRQARRRARISIRDVTNDPAPVGEPEELASQHRPDHGGQPDHEHQLREDPGRARAGAQVPDDRPGDDQRRSAAQALGQSQGQQDGDVARDRAQERRDREGQDTPAQRRHPADPVAQGTDHELTQRQAHQAHGQLELRECVRGAQGAGQVRQGRQVQVGDQRRRRGQRAEGQQRPAGRGLVRAARVGGTAGRAGRALVLIVLLGTSAGPRQAPGGWGRTLPWRRRDAIERACRWHDPPLSRSPFGRCRRAFHSAARRSGPPLELRL